MVYNNLVMYVHLIFVLLSAFIIIYYCLFLMAERNKTQRTDKRLLVNVSRVLLVIPAFVASFLAYTLFSILSSSIDFWGGVFFILLLLILYVLAYLPVHYIYKKINITLGASEQVASVSRRRILLYMFIGLLLLYSITVFIMYMGLHFDRGHASTTEINGVAVPESVLIAGSDAVIWYCRTESKQAFRVAKLNFGGVADYYSMSGYYLGSQAWSDLPQPKLPSMLSHWEECKTIKNRPSS